jgi:hypothetical protein
MKLYKQIYPRLRSIINPQAREINEIEKIFFLHIPKCGGSSLSRAIRSTYGSSSEQQKVCFSLNSNSVRKCSQILEAENQEYRKQILAYVMSANQHKYIHGHFAYCDRIFQEFGNQWHYITLLRQPVAQWFSQYFYDQRSDSQIKINDDLGTFIDSDRAVLMGNTYVRKLTEGIPASEASSPEAVKAAIANLQKFSLVGILENLDLFAKEYNYRFKRSLQITERLNQNPVAKAKQQQQITEPIKQKVEKLCQPNWQVYQAALNKNY